MPVECATAMRWLLGMVAASLIVPGIVIGEPVTVFVAVSTIDNVVADAITRRSPPTETVNSGAVTPASVP